MCKASIDYPGAPDGIDGGGITIGTNGWGMGTAFRQMGTSPSNDHHGATAEDDGCPICCLHTGTRLQVTWMPDEIRALLGLDPNQGLELIFVETPGSHRVVIHDLVTIVGRPELGQIRFAAFDGCEATITKATRRDEVTPEMAIGESAAIVEVDETDPVEALKAMVAQTMAAHRSGDGETDAEPSRERVSA